MVALLGIKHLLTCKGAGVVMAVAVLEENERVWSLLVGCATMLM